MTHSEFRSKSIVKELSVSLHETARDLKPLTIMHVCGTHEREICRYGIRQLLPPNIRLIAGPGCPVCITPASVIATAVALALHPSRPIFCTYGDMVRVPISTGSILDSRLSGADVRVILGIRDAVQIAYDNPLRSVIFFSIGFETTAAPVAAAIRKGLPVNFTLYCCHRYVPKAVEALATADDGSVSGYMLPGHASVITGKVPYEFISRRFQRPAAITGFEPVDILAGLLSIVRQVKRNSPAVVNCYTRVVRDKGNTAALSVLNQVFTLTDAPWRGIGIIPETGFELNAEYERYNALHRFGIVEQTADDILPGCICHLILTGRRVPSECPLFFTVCTPDNPQGPCMVGAEGTCRADFMYPEDSSCQR